MRSAPLSLDQQNRYRELYERLRPGYRYSGRVYESLVARYITPLARVLDAGCGRVSVMDLFKNEVRQVVGLDNCLASLRHNTQLGQLVLGDLARLPFEEGVFDLIVCTWVVEHLEEPDLAFAEMACVLRQGGHLVILTPNAWNWVVLASRLLPASWRRFLVRRIYGRGEENTFPVAYKANSPPALDRKLRRAGLRKEELNLVGDPSYLAFNDLSFKMSALLERITDFSFLRALKVHLVASYVKD